MRLITKYSWYRPTRIFFSNKNAHHFFMESALERAMALRCEFDPQVTEYFSQPQPLYYRIPGETKERRYTPDMWLSHAVMGEVIVEVKPERHARKPILKAKHALLAERYAELGLCFLVMTETQIQQDDLIDNLSNLYRFRRFPIDPKGLRALKKRFPNGMTLAEVTADLTQDESLLSLAYQALAHGHALTDLTQRISEKTYMEWKP